MVGPVRVVVFGAAGGGVLVVCGGLVVGACWGCRPWRGQGPGAPAFLAGLPSGGRRLLSVGAGALHVGLGSRWSRAGEEVRA